MSDYGSAFDLYDEDQVINMAESPSAQSPPK